MARSRPTPLALVELEDRSTPTTFTWSGAGTTNNFSDKANWGGTAPGTTGTDDLVFPAGAARMSTLFNDFATTAVFHSVVISGSGYTIGGFNGFSLSGGGIAEFALGHGVDPVQVSLDELRESLLVVVMGVLADEFQVGHLDSVYE